MRQNARLWSWNKSTVQPFTLNNFLTVSWMHAFDWIADLFRQASMSVTQGASSPRLAGNDDAMPRDKWAKLWCEFGNIWGWWSHSCVFPTQHHSTLNYSVMSINDYDHNTTCVFEPTLQIRENHHRLNYIWLHLYDWWSSSQPKYRILGGKAQIFKDCKLCCDAARFWSNPAASTDRREIYDYQVTSTITCPERLQIDLAEVILRHLTHTKMTGCKLMRRCDDWIWIMIREWWRWPHRLHQPINPCTATAS